MEKSSSAADQKPNYKVKSIEPIMTGSDMQARLFTLGPGETIPWHYHETAADHYFVLEGTLTVVTREPQVLQTVGLGNDHRIAPGTPHLISNRASADCRFLLLQGVGKYDWVKLDR